MNTALTVIAICIVVFSCSCLFAAIAYGAFKIYKSLKSVADGLASLNDQMSGVPVILAGVRKICEELAAYTVNVSGSVDKLRTSLFDGQKSGARPPKDDHFRPYDEAEAGAEYQIMQLVREHNISYAAARDRVASGLEEGRFMVGEDE